MAQEDAFLVVGLGNPGPRYERTYHNLGFLAADRIAERNAIRITRKEAQALVGVGSIAGRPVVVAKPQTFMNESGVAVRLLLEKYEIEPSRLVLLYDELDLPWTAVRIRPRGSAGGHHGVESVIRHAGTQQFPRIRLGIDPGHPVSNGADFVLSPIKRGQEQELDELLDHTAQAVESIIAEGVEKSMTKFNRRARGSEEAE